jgi:hypothetical protein
MRVAIWALMGVVGLALLGAAAVFVIDRYDRQTMADKRAAALQARESAVYKEGDRFLALLREGKTTEAYLSTGKALQARQDEARFTRAVQGVGLSDCAYVQWHRCVLGNNELGRLEGVVRTREEIAIPVTMTLVRENGAWRVLSVTGAPVGVSSGTGRVSGNEG